VTPPTHIGRYRILGQLGQGAMGTVYRARDESLERDVALKVMALGQADADARARFLREARAAARLQHPNIVTIYELGEHEGSPFMALELLEGIDLQRAIEDGIRPDPKVTLPIVLQTLAGLGHAHENGIVHRDVKPSNIFLPRGRPAKIMDFGVARLVGGATTAGLVVGTPHYMSPEQVMAGDIDGRSDLFSVGLILYELVTGEKAYQGDTIVTLLYKIVHETPNLDLIPKGPQWERLNRVLARAAEKDRERRHPDAAAMASELKDALVDLGGSPDWTTRSDQALMVRTRAGSRAPEATVGSAPTAPSAAGGPPGESPPVASRLPLAAAGALAVGAAGLLAVAVWLTTRPAPGPLPSPQRVASTAPGPPAPAPAAPSVVTARPSEPASATPRPGPPAPASLALETPTPPPGPAPASARLDRANDSMEKGSYAQALAEARAILARDPNNADARALAGDAEAALLIEDCVKRAKAALKTGDRDLALEEIRKGLLVNPSEGRLLALHREATQ
jgi:eukaryotic-like serine/threonine-protein kinase